MTHPEVDHLGRRLSDEQWEVRLEAVEQVIDLGPEAVNLVPKLWEMAAVDPSPDVRGTAIQTIIAIERSNQILVAQLIEKLRGKNRDQHQLVFAMLAKVDLSEGDRVMMQDQLWSVLRRGDVGDLEQECLLALIAVSPEGNTVLRMLLADSEIDAQRKCVLVLSTDIRGEVLRRTVREPETMIPLMIDILVDEGVNDRGELISLLIDCCAVLPSRWLHVLRDGVWQIMIRYGQCFDAYCQLVGHDKALSRLVGDPAIPQEVVGALLLTSSPPGLLRQYLAGDEYACIAHILEALVHPDWMIRLEASDWIGRNGARLAQDLYQQCVASLERRVREELVSDVRWAAERALETLISNRQRNRLMRQGKLVNMLRDESLGEETRAKVIESLAHSETREGMAAIVCEWLIWLSTPRRSMLIEVAEEQLRGSKYSVLPLLDQIEELTIVQETDDEGSHGTGFRKLEARRHILRLLSEMSAKRFYNGENTLHEAIVAELHKHAVPVLARRLPDEGDFEIRESTAYLLASVGGSEAVSALTRAITAKERTRRSRQDLLSTYYLDPTKKRSEQAARILDGAVSEARRTMRVVQGLNIMLFAVGLIIIGGSLMVALLGDESASRVLGILAALGTLGGLIVQLIHNPMERIQESLTRLVQIETAFTSFIWELNLNSTYIQSLYVSDGRLDDDSIAKTLSRIEQAMELTLTLVDLGYDDKIHGSSES